LFTGSLTKITIKSSKNMTKALIIFIKNPRLGKVKTRLAATLGDKKALVVYEQLLKHTRQICEKVAADRLLFYSSYISEDDDWDGQQFRKFVQVGVDLGERMNRAFEAAFERYGYQKVVIIGSDCADLTADIITTAFQQLEQHDTVIGPANDGGYYLLGMNRLFTAVFEEKYWSTPSVFEDTMADIETAGLTCYMLPELTDIDNQEDLESSLFGL